MPPNKNSAFYLKPDSHPCTWRVNEKWNLVKLELIRTLLRITRQAHSKSYLVINCPNAQENLTTSEIMSDWRRFEHCSESLIISGNYFPLQIKQKVDLIWNKVKLLFAPIWFHLPLFDPKIQFVSIFRVAYLHLSLFTYIWPYLDLITPIWSYLPLIALIAPSLCAIFIKHMYSSIEKIIHRDIALQRIYGCRKCWHECSLCVYLVIDNFWGIQSVVWLRIQLLWSAQCQISIATNIRVLNLHIKLYHL